MNKITLWTIVREVVYGYIIASYLVANGYTITLKVAIWLAIYPASWTVPIILQNCIIIGIALSCSILCNSTFNYAVDNTQLSKCFYKA